ncbi:sialate O-acetylesterase [Candidatus Poribacteria bacterium]|nr:sialate O-acetylesterase [Candidatus Poribacteria bacterium]
MLCLTFNQYFSFLALWHRKVRRQILYNPVTILSFSLSLLFPALHADADVKLPAMISDNMVLQQGMEIPIWGIAEPGEQVTVTLGEQKANATADSEGRWIIKLEPLDAGGPYEITVAGKNTIILYNVLVGEVWVCAGQSNMQWPVNMAANAEQEIAGSNYPTVRFFTVKRTVSDEPQEDTEGSWVACSPETVKSFSAVGYFFGRYLRKELGIPVGLIHSSWGGTPAEAWTSRSTLESEPEFKPILDRWEQILANYPQEQEKYQKLLAQWEQEVENARKEGKPEPNKPQPPIGPDHPYRPAGLYNGMIAPLIPYAIKGAIWYQGESNAVRAYQYRKLFPAMIHNWRHSWGQGDFPFLFVQLANFNAPKFQWTEGAWPELREAQLMTLALPKTAMAVTIDIGETDDIHPKNKQDVGHRLGLAALAIAYDHDVVYSGPIYESMAVENDKVRLRFRHIDGGLMTKNGEQLIGFAIAGANPKFVWAEAKIDRDTVVVWSDQVPQPMAVRYAWADNPVCNLYNKAGLPASPFRTDDWPGVTQDKQ